MLGMNGSRAANMAVQESDLRVVVGARFDDRATGKLAEFAPLAEVIHLDLDAAEVGKLRHAHAGVVGDVAASLRALAGVIPDDPRSEEHTSELQSLMRISYAVFCLKQNIHHTITSTLIR